MNANSIVVVGSANVDLNTYAHSLPRAGETVLGKEFKTSLGGKGANQAVAAALLSASNSVHFICKVGNDDHGMELTRNFDKVGVQYNRNDVISTENHTGIATITVDSSGENTIIVVPGSNHDLTAEGVKCQIMDIRQRSNIRILMTQLEIKPDVAWMAMKTGRDCGALTILNPAPVPSVLDNRFFHCVDIIIPNESELRSLVEDPIGMSHEDMAKELLRKGIQKAVVVTLGAKGAMIVQREESLEDNWNVDTVNAPQDVLDTDEPVIDTVGAGDAFCGSLAVYLSSGSNLVDAVRNACGVASMTVRKIGAQSSYPRLHELPTCLRLNSKLEYHDIKKTCLTFVTGNKKKLEEVKSILSVEGRDMPFSITSKNIDLPELQGEDPASVAIEKCKLAVKAVQGPVFIEDTSLCFNALNGMPGLYIKWFLERLGHDGLNRMLDGFADRSAYAQTIIAFTVGVGEEIHTFEGRTMGTIVSARGRLDFGWDPIFEPDEGKGLTYAEMDKDDKNKISHRARSFAKFSDFLFEHFTPV